MKPLHSKLSHFGFMVMNVVALGRTVLCWVMLVAALLGDDWSPSGLGPRTPLMPK